MKGFGIISILIVVCVSVWMLVGQTTESEDGTKETKVESYQSAVDSAHEAVGSVEKNNLETIQN